MVVLVRKALIVDPTSPHHLQRADLLLENGVIQRIATTLDAPEGSHLIESSNLHVSGGWCELHADFADPGHEEREDLSSGRKAAARGGYTHVALVPSTNPVVQTKSDIEYILSGNRNSAVACLPLGALSKDRKGEELAQYYEMAEAGAVGLYDDQPVPNSKLLQLALLYGQNAGIRVFSRPDDGYLSKGGQMHEGPVSTYLGLRGIPNTGEVLGIMRDLELVKYTGSAIHFTNLSTAEGVELIRQAKKEGLPISADVAVANLVFTDSILENYDTRYKVYPPLRDENAKKALWNGVLDGTLDAISSNHSPQDIELKQCEFDRAAFGMSTIEVAYSMLNSHQSLSPELWVTKACINPRALLNLPLPSVVEGAQADLTFFDPDAAVSFNKSTWLSRSANTPVFGLELKGKVMGVYQNGKLAL